jgi:hypothetical protein
MAAAAARMPGCAESISYSCPDFTPTTDRSKRAIEVAANLDAPANG